MFFSSKGVLGINARNLLYLRPYNEKKAVKLADDKIKTKQFLSTRGIPVPRLLGNLKSAEEARRFDFNSLPRKFVVKPNHGFGGEGIIPLVHKIDGHFVSTSGKKLTEDDLREHVIDIIDGRYSLGNIRDSAFFEQLIVCDERIARYSFAGLPDIRIVVHNLIPVMAMLRLPTRQSNGKANLHMGAVGVGIDIAKGYCTFITHKNKIIDQLPDELGSLKGFRLPFWDEMLLIASKVQLLTNLGYMAVDIAIDKNVGPVLLEINARAGLGVQVANLAPLRKRLERIEGVKVTTPMKGVRIAKDMFGNIIEKEIANLSGKEVIRTEEVIGITRKDGVLELDAKVNTARDRSVLDYDTAEKSGLLNDKLAYSEEKHTLKLKLAIKGRRLKTIVDLRDRSNNRFKFSIGRRDLKNFLIDATLEKTPPPIKSSLLEPKIITRKPMVNHREIDNKLANIDGQIRLLYHLKPVNFSSERDKFMKDNSYNPQFEYPPLNFESDDLIARLLRLEIDDTPIGQILDMKRRELINKVNLLDSIDQPSFTDFSTKLFGQPTKVEYHECLELLNEMNIKDIKVKRGITNIDALTALKEFRQVFKNYGLDGLWKAKIKDHLVARCVAGKSRRLFVRKGAKFSKEAMVDLVVHEIETHILTAENGAQQKYQIFNRGLANYLVTQEGMAMYNVEKYGGKLFFENYNALGLVVAVHESIKKSFSEVFYHLRRLGIPKVSAFKIALKAKRGISNTENPGAFTKDYVYYRGYLQVKNFMDNGGDMRDLYIGKFNLDDLALVKSVQGLRPAKHFPAWLKN